MLSNWLMYAVALALTLVLSVSAAWAQTQNRGFQSGNAGVQKGSQTANPARNQNQLRNQNQRVNNGIERAQQPLGPRKTVQRDLPRPFPEQRKEFEDFVDEILKYWEVSSSKINRYRSQFSRYEYEETFLNLRDPRTNHIYAKTLATGIVRYEKPDKGMYETQNIWNFVGPPKKAGEEPQYKKASAERLEKWICDGKSIFEFKPTTKQVIERILPPEMQGERISNGPLPFMFGVTKAEMRARYWVRVVTPKDAKGEYWLEAYPKKIDDARNYQKVEVILAEEDFLPKFITVFEPNHNPAKKQTRKTSFEFKKREYNWLKLPDEIRLFSQSFYRPKTPKGWQLVRENLAAQAIRDNRTSKNQKTLGSGQSRIGQKSGLNSRRK